MTDKTAQKREWVIEMIPTLQPTCWMAEDRYIKQYCEEDETCDQLIINLKEYNKVTGLWPDYDDFKFGYDYIFEIMEREVAHRDMRALYELQSSADLIFSNYHTDYYPELIEFLALHNPDEESYKLNYMTTLDECVTFNDQVTQTLWKIFAAGKN